MISNFFAWCAAIIAAIIMASLIMWTVHNTVEHITDYEIRKECIRKATNDVEILECNQQANAHDF